MLSIVVFCSLFEQNPDMFRFLLLVQHGQLSRVTDDMQTPVKVLRAVIDAAAVEAAVREASPIELDFGYFGDPESVSQVTADPEIVRQISPVIVIG